MKFKEYITEARLAPLYHGITNANDYFDIFLILKSNLLKGNKHGHEVNGKYVDKGVSLTRSLQFALAWSEQDIRIVLEFDQQKLIQKYKIVPFNFFPTMGARSKSESSYAMRIGSRYPHGFDNQMEEYLIGDLKNVKDYITKIIISDYQRFKYIIKYNENLNRGFSLYVQDHPKLYDLKTKRFVNDI